MKDCEQGGAEGLQRGVQGSAGREREAEAGDQGELRGRGVEG